MPAARPASKTRSADGSVRAAAVLYLVLVATSLFGLVASQSLTVAHDPVATARNIHASETLFRLALISSLTATIAFVFLSRELYRLFWPVNGTLASLMVVLVLLSIPLSFLSSLNQIAALRLIDGPALVGLAPGQTYALASFFLGLSSDTSAVNSIFFGLWLLPLGLLVIRSGFIPKILGYSVLIAGFAYLVGSLNFLLSPPFGRVVSTIATVGYVGELAVVVWLVVKAIEVQFVRSNSSINGATKRNSNLQGGTLW